MSVTYALEDQVAVITFDDGKANVYTHDVLRSLGEALDQADRDARAVLLAGRPGRFSAGFDLATMTAGPEPMRGLVEAGARFVARLLLEPLPVGRGVHRSCPGGRRPGTPGRGSAHRGVG